MYTNSKQIPRIQTRKKHLMSIKEMNDKYRFNTFNTLEIISVLMNKSV